MDYREWWLSEAEVIKKFKPNNTGCVAHWIPIVKEGVTGIVRPEDYEISEIYLYQDGRYIDRPQELGVFQEAVAERTDEDIEIMNRQLGWISHARKVAGEHREKVIAGKIGMMKTEAVNTAITQADIPEITENLPPKREPDPELVEDYTGWESEDWAAKALNSM